ncbi:2OG-Fe(II) oxygenase [Porphyrobacter sp. GA68]|uniref:prolyl hydroxylase family protein n=1 Tax=Porphyrobacter sp. GA68 TaxID=2883480 RepID=UPI001D18F0B6|nr:2OG-Fe(II) oxygenase [Porphyrobacter sp. GA68]
MPDVSNIPDQAALKRLGASVRQRLAANPSAYAVETDRAELFAIGDFLTQAECARFIDLTDACARPSALHDMEYAKTFRTSSSGDFDPADPLVKAVSRRMDDLLGIDPAFGETVQGQRYQPGQEFKPHNDWFHPDQPYWPLERDRGGQRSWTAMAFLNEVEEGGETDFPVLGLSIAPKPGALLVWNNAAPDGTPNEATLHAGTPVTRGVKYVLTKWYRTRRWT